MRLPVIDLDARDPAGWTRSLEPVRGAGRDLLAATQDIARDRARAAGWAGPAALAALRAALRVLHAAHRPRRGAEVAAAARAIGCTPAELYFANLAYELGTLGCSTFVRDGAAGPLLARNLDWPFPGDLLRRHACVVRVRGAPSGEYAMVTWPGFVGALTAVAPGRFALAVNFVRWRGGGPARLLGEAARGALPVTWAVRDALDDAPGYAAALDRLAATPLLAPALFTISGLRRGEGAVVERTTRGAAVRPLARGVVCASNHYLSPTLAGQSVDYDEGGSFARLASLERGLAGAAPRDARDALALLAPNVRDTTQQQVVMRAGDGLLVVRLPGRRAHTIPL